MIKSIVLVIAIVIVIVIGVFCWVSKRRYEKTEYYSQTHNSYHTIHSNKGAIGEYLIWKYLHKLRGHQRYIFNCYIPKENGETTEIDVILLHESGIYVFESKNYSGWIFGNETQQYWTQTLPAGRGRSQKERFFNPVTQNKVHLKWLSKYLNKDINLFYSYIVFSDRCTLKDVTIPSGQHHVINRYNILPEVQLNARLSGQKLTVNEIDSLYATLRPLTQVDEAQKLAHVETIRKKKTSPHSNSKLNNGQVICPLCGEPLVLKTASRGSRAGTQFWGCSNYPKCRYIHNIDPEKMDA